MPGRTIRFAGLLVVAAALPFMSGWFVDQLQRSVESGLSGIGVG